MAQQGLIPFDDNMKLPAELAALGDGDEDWGSGQIGGFPVISLKGKHFTVIRGDASDMIMNPNDPDEPASSIEVVILRTHKGTAKTYYEKAYSPDSVEKPDCYSNDGVEPAADAQSPQSKKCATCPHNQWGSRISDEGKKGKACSDVKRLAVASPTQLNDPMLLRLPPTTLKIWDEYVRMLNKRGGYRPAQVVTKIRFDPEAVHQQLTFKATALISADMAKQVMEERDTLIVRNIIGVGPDAGPPVQAAPAVEKEAAPVEEPPEKPAKAKKPAAKAEAPKETEKPAPAAAEVDMDELGDDLDAMLDGLGFDDD
jgi:hypothetical protein